MATRAVTITNLDATADNQSEGVIVASWTGLTNATTDDGAPVGLAAFSDRAVQVTGTFGTGGNLRMEGSIDGTTYHVLTDPQGNALDFTTAKIEAVSELVRLIRPRITAGDGTTNLACSLIARRIAR